MLPVSRATATGEIASRIAGAPPAQNLAIQSIFVLTIRFRLFPAIDEQERIRLLCRSGGFGDQLQESVFWIGDLERCIEGIGEGRKLQGQTICNSTRNP